MTETRVLACSLNARDAAERAERWRRLLDDHVVGRDALPAGRRGAAGCRSDVRGAG
jgi:hypothetical protein